MYPPITGKSIYFHCRPSADFLRNNRCSRMIISCQSKGGTQNLSDFNCVRKKIIVLIFSTVEVNAKKTH